MCDPYIHNNLKLKCFVYLDLWFDLLVDDGEESLNDSDDGIADVEEEEELEESSEDESENENIADFQSKLKLQSTKGEFR